MSLEPEDPLDESAPPIEVRGLVSRFGDNVIHDHLDLSIPRGQVVGIVGGSGAGKSVLLNTVIGLRAPQAGSVKIFGQDIRYARRRQWTAIERRWGVLFQQGALWSNLTVKENVSAPMLEHTLLSKAEIDELSDLKIALAGLPHGAGALKPSELSGGMIKRASLARALALDPELLFLDEPSAGLDPVSSRRLDDLILQLRDGTGASFVVVSHELASLFAIGDDGIFLDADSKRPIAHGSPKDMLAHCDHPTVQAFLRREAVKDAGTHDAVVHHE